jgi:hypothetical protein
MNAVEPKAAAVPSGPALDAIAALGSSSEYRPQFHEPIACRLDLIDRAAQAGAIQSVDRRQQFCATRCLGDLGPAKSRHCVLIWRLKASENDEDCATLLGGDHVVNSVANRSHYRRPVG